MAIIREGVSDVEVGSLLEQDLRIPSYQRPYSWQPTTALHLLDDIRDALKTRPDVPYILGAVILYQAKPGDPYDVVDGQQRLLTLKMIQSALESPPSSRVGVPAGENPVSDVRRALAVALPADALSFEERLTLREFITRRCQ